MARNTLRLTALAALTAVALAVATAGAQAQYTNRPVPRQSHDTRLNLSTQPLYAPFSRRAYDYTQLPYLYSSNNLRGGAYFRGNRNFLEDRYYNSSLGRFFTDSTGAGDVRGGVHYGAPQPYFNPGSLTTRAATVQRGTGVGQADPFGLSFNPDSSLPRPGSAVYNATPQVDQFEVPTAGQYPSPTAQRGWLQDVLSSLEQPDLAPPPGYQSFLETEDETDPMRPELEPFSETAKDMQPQLRFRPGITFQQQPAEGEPQPGRPWQFGPEGQTLDENAPPMMIRDPGYTDGQPEDFGTQPPRAAQPMTLLPPMDLGPEEPRRLDETGRPVEQVAPLEVTTPKASGTSARPLPLGHQYLERGREQFAQGNIRQAAETWNQAAGFDPSLRWEASTREAMARLMLGEYFIGAYLLRQSITRRTEFWIADGRRLSDIAGDAAAWRQAEQQIAEDLESNPVSTSTAFCLACVKLFTPGDGSPQDRLADARRLLTRAETSAELAPAARLLMDYMDKQ